jgi:GTPase SAR1 family protein
MQIEKYAQPNVHMLIIGNKCDAEQNRQVDKGEAEKYCKEKKIKHIEASAKQGDNVSESFQELSEILTKLFPKANKDKTTPGSEDVKKKRKEFQLQSGKEAGQANKSCCS